MGPWSDPKSEFSRTKSPDRDPRESQKCLLGTVSSSILKTTKVQIKIILFLPIYDQEESINILLCLEYLDNIYDVLCV